MHQSAFIAFIVLFPRFWLLYIQIGSYSAILVWVPGMTDFLKTGPIKKPWLQIKCPTSHDHSLKMLYIWHETLCPTYLHQVSQQWYISSLSPPGVSAVRYVQPFSTRCLSNQIWPAVSTRCLTMRYSSLFPPGIPAYLKWPNVTEQCFLSLGHSDAVDAHLWYWVCLVHCICHVGIRWWSLANTNQW